MDWVQGYSASYYMTVVDPASWRDIRTVDITGGSISKSDSSLMESAQVELTENLGEAWVRIWLDARQGDGGGRTPLFTGLLQTPATRWDGNIDTYSAECYSVLKAADDVILQRGWYALAGQNGVALAARLLDATPAPVIVDDDPPMLSTSIIAEDNETALTMARRLVTASGWRMKIDGDGTIRICPLADRPSVILDTQTNDIVELSISDEQDLYKCPNVYMAASGDLTYTARDEESIEARGREIWAVEYNVTLNAGESIMQYALRKLEEKKAAARTVKYSRRYIPDLTPGDIIELRFPRQGIFGDYRVNKQSVSLGYAATVSEECVETYRIESPAIPLVEVMLLTDGGDYLVTDGGDYLTGEI